MAATPAVSVRLITRAPLLKIVRLVNQTNSVVPLLKDWEQGEATTGSPLQHLGSGRYGGDG